MTVRKATAADGATIASTFASAFAEDPVMRWMSGQADTERRLGPFWRSMVKGALRVSDAEVYVTDDGGSAAVWRGIDRWRLPPSQIARDLPVMVASLRSHIPRALRMLVAVEKAHPREPHYYLAILGTRRGHQGHGGGSAVLAPMLERCDREGVPAYLESSNPRNVPFYARHGFVERPMFESKGWPTITLMWREPRD